MATFKAKQVDVDTESAGRGGSTHNASSSAGEVTDNSSDSEGKQGSFLFLPLR